MYFEDLTPYSYWETKPYSAGFLEREPWPIDPIVNVGWLEPGHPFPVGQVDLEFVEALDRWMNDYRVRPTRGFHQCGFCVGAGVGDEFGDEFRRASAEFRVRGRGRTYAAPYLLKHYVVRHGYLPPEEFRNAVLCQSQPGTSCG